MKCLIYSVIILFFACEEVVTIDLEEGPKRLVVEARLEKRLESTQTDQLIVLTTTSNYFSNKAAPAATGAVVTVNDGTTDYTFTERIDKKGYYEIDDLPIDVNKSYTLTIHWEGNSYLSTEKVSTVPKIDRIYSAYSDGNIFDEAGYRVYIDFIDNEDVENYYYWKQYRDGK